MYDTKTLIVTIHSILGELLAIHKLNFVTTYTYLGHISSVMTCLMRQMSKLKPDNYMRKATCFVNVFTFVLLLFFIIIHVRPVGEMLKLFFTNL